MTIHVAVIGAKGRVGSTIVEAVRATEDMEFIAALDAENEILPEFFSAAEVAVDFSISGVTESGVYALLDAGVNVVVGTTDWTEESYERVHVYTEELGRAVLIASNFAMGAVLAMGFAALAVPYFESAEVIEMYHPNKVDASSGMAIATAWGIGTARKGTGLGSMPDATQLDPEGIRGDFADGVPVHVVCLRGLTASEEVLLGNLGEQPAIRMDSLDRVSFMPGMILAIRSIQGRVGPAVGLDKILDI